VESVSLSDPPRDEQLRAGFERLAAQNPQHGLDWLLNLARYALDEGDSAVLYIARNPEGGLVALPLRISSDGRADALGNFYTSSLAPLVDCATPVPLFTAIFAHLARAEGIHSLTLSPLDPAAQHFEWLQQALAGSGWRGRHSYFCFGNWTHSLQGADWEQYLSSLPTRVANTVKRKTRKLLQAENSGVRIVTGGPTLEAAISQYVSIYNQSWKRPEPYREFMPGLLRLAARKGWLRLAIADLQGQAIAAQVWLVCDGTAYIFKLAYDQKFSQYSPGTILTAKLMEHVIEHDRVKRIDYLSGDDGYKQDWMSERGERHGLAAYNPRTLRGCVMMAGRSLKRAAGKILPGRAGN
jgi:CelD/BcsL family acetyltransferase involved in cellulose biosynthesis